MSAFAGTVDKCIAAPTLQCLVDAASAEMVRFVESGDERAAPYVNDFGTWHRKMATAHLHLDDLHGASEAATGMRPRELILFVRVEILPRSPAPRDVKPLLDWARRILEVQFADRDVMPGHDPSHSSKSIFLEFRAEARRLIAQVRLLLDEDPFDLSSAVLEDEIEMNLWKPVVANGFVQNDHYEEAVPLVSAALAAAFEDPEVDHWTRVDYLAVAAWALAGADY